MMLWTISRAKHDINSVNGGLYDGAGSKLGSGFGSGAGSGDGYYGYDGHSFISGCGYGYGFGIGSGSGSGNSVIIELTNSDSCGDIRQWCDK